jgi:hypothetical protein
MGLSPAPYARRIFGPDIKDDLKPPKDVTAVNGSLRAKARA